jgi:hypothetical protein
LDARAVDPDVAGVRKRDRCAARTHEAGMPQPSIEALAIDFNGRAWLEHDLFGKPASTLPDHALATALGLGFQLSLQRGELCKWRVRIGRLFAPFVSHHRTRHAVRFAPRTVEALMRSLPAAVA